MRRASRWSSPAPVRTPNLSYSAMNFVGSVVLAVVGVQWGFILLQGVWAILSLWGMITILRGGEPGARR